MKIRFPKITRTERVRVEPEGVRVTVAEVVAALGALEQDAEVTDIGFEEVESPVASLTFGGYRSVTSVLGVTVKKVRSAK